MEIKFLLLFLHLIFVIIISMANAQIYNDLPEGMRDNPAYDLFKKDIDDLNEQHIKAKKQADELNKQQVPSDEQPRAPIVYGKFACDPDLVLNTVRHEVMTNSNYNR